MCASPRFRSKENGHRRHPTKWVSQRDPLVAGELVSRRQTTATAFRRLPEGLALDMRHCLPDPKVEETSLRLMPAADGRVTKPRDRQFADPARTLV
jgi:hypothetical protein